MSTENTTNSRPLPVSRGGTGRTNLVGANSLRSDLNNFDYFIIKLKFLLFDERELKSQ